MGFKPILTRQVHPLRLRLAHYLWYKPAGGSFSTISSTAARLFYPFVTKSTAWPLLRNRHELFANELESRDS